MASYFPMVKNSAQRIVFPILDADGDPVTGAAADTPDSEYSLDGASFVDIADEIHEIATTSGIYYLDLTADETNGDVVCIQVKTATAGTKTTVLVFYTAAQSLDTMDTNIDDIETDTAVIGALGAGLTAIPWNSAWDAEAQSECADALTAYDPPTRAELTTDKNSIITEVDANETKIDAIQTDLDNATDGLGALKALLDTISGYTDLIDDATNGLTAIKAEVEGLAGAAMRGTDNAATEAKQDIMDTVVDGIQTDLNNVTDGLGALKALIDAVQTQVDTTGVALLASAVDAIWDEDVDTTHQTAGTAGKKLDDAGAGAGGDATIAKQDEIIAALVTVQADLDAPDQYKAREHIQL